MRTLILAFLLAWFVAEAWLFLVAGPAMGLLGVMAWIFLSFLLGLLLLRVEGWRLLIQMHGQLQRGVVPARELVDGAGIVAGALLLMLPGFLSDAVGFLLLVPPSRWVMLGMLARVLSIRWSAVPAARIVPPSEEVIEVRPERGETHSPTP
jgi:UPF0716 protein FxsA